MWPAPTGVDRGVSPTPPPMAALVLNKAAFGPRPGDVDAFNALGGDDFTRLSAWVDQQLNPTVADPDLDARLNPLLGAGSEYDTINKTPQQLWTDHHRFEGQDEYLVRNRPVWQMERLLLLRAVWSQWQLREVLADFWFNHFNVLGQNFVARSMLPHYDAMLRQHIFGNFYDMLEANSRTATMLYYLDNFANSWPNPNENYAREVLELHTLGAIENYYAAVDPSTVPNNAQGQRAGYTEIDVFQFARALTGWGVEDGDDDGPDTGDFLFRPERHYDFSDGPIEVMDVTINGPGGGESDVTDILTYLANHYGTARYISWKLCTRLIGDDPPESIVSSTADQFYNRRADADQLKEVCRHVLLSNEFQTTWGTKVKRPIETVARALRGTNADLTIRLDDSASNEIIFRLDDTGHYPFNYEAPTGFPDEKTIWQGSGPLITTWRTVTRLLRNTTTLNLADQTNTGIPVAADRTPTNLVDFWMTRALGYPLDAGASARMVTFVADISGVGATDPLDNAGNIDTTDTGNFSRYQRIMRALVGLVLMAPDSMRR